MYSSVLLIVETSLKGVDGSGEMPTTDVDSQAVMASSSTRPTNCT